MSFWRKRSQDDRQMPSELYERYVRTGDLADLERAIEALGQAVEQSQPDSAKLPIFLNDLGGARWLRYRLTGELADLEATIEATEQAVEQSQPSSADRPAILNGFGQALRTRYERTGELADLEVTIEALGQAVERFQPGSADRPPILNGLGQVLWERFTRTGELSDLEEAINTWEEAWSLLQTTFAASPVTYKIGQQRGSSRISAPLVSALLQLAQKDKSTATAARRRALEIAEGSKSRLLTELIGRTDLPAPPSIRSSLVDRERQVLHELTAMDTAELTTYGPWVTSQEEASHFVRLQRREEHLQELENLWAQMSQADYEAADYVALRRGTPATWANFARLATDLGSDIALVSFFTLENHALLFIVRAGWEEPAIVEAEISDSTWIDTMQRLFREIHTSRGSTRRGETWHRSLKRLLENAKPHLGGVTHVVFAPYSEGHLIPWSVIAERAGWRNPDQESIPFVTLPALGLLPRLRHRPSRSDGPALVAGNPLGDLEYAEAEAREVAAVLGTSALLGPQATKEKVQTHISEAAVVHLATHAYFEPNSPLDSGVVFANGDVLTAREVMDERLRADLLILSACETGMAQALGGDELAGLGQAFLQGGARSVIVSLWSVNDSATAALMKVFYEARHAGVDNAEALSQAMIQIEEQEKWHHPYYWGAFVFMGDW